MKLTEQAKATLPNMPTPLFDMFITPLLGNALNVLSPFGDSRWFYHFGGLSLYQFSQLRWNISTLLINKDILHPNSNSDIQLLITDHVKNIETPIRRNVMDSKIRFDGLVEYIKRTRCLPAPIVLIRTGYAFRILDGSHRIAALFSLGLNDTIPIKAWLGE